MFGSKHNIQKDLAELRQQIVENSLELQAVTQVKSNVIRNFSQNILPFLFDK